MNACLGQYSKDPTLIEAYKKRRYEEIALARAQAAAAAASAAATNAAAGAAIGAPQHH